MSVAPGTAPHRTPGRTASRPGRRRAAAPAGFALALLCAVAAPASAAWTAPGTPVCTNPGDQSAVLAASDGAGGLFVAWTDLRAGGAADADVYLQHLDSAGDVVAGWPLDGLAVCDATGAQRPNDLAPDGLGGVLLAWRDTRADALGDIYVLRVLADGSVAAGWPADGLGVCTAALAQDNPLLAADGSGGAFVNWRDRRECSTCRPALYAQHVDASGAIVAGWTADGTRVSADSDYVSPMVAPVPDGGGGAYFAWSGIAPRIVLRAQHLAADGSPAPSWPAGGATLAQTIGEDDGLLGLVPGPSGTAVVAWTHFDQDNWGCDCIDWQDFRARAFGPDTSTVSGWPPAGVPIAQLPGYNRTSVTGDGSGGLLMAWSAFPDYPNSYALEIHAAHVLSSGLLVTSVAAPDGQVLVRATQGPVGFSKLAPDGAGGAFVGWNELGALQPGAPDWFNYDPFVHHVTAGATLDPLWPAAGTVVTTSTLRDDAPALVHRGGGGVLAAWSRGDVAASGDVYAGLVGADGVVPALVSLVSSEASPERVRLTWQVAGAATAEWRIERRDEASPWSEIARALPDGEGRVRVTDGSVAAGARYGYRLATEAGGAALGETWIDVPRAGAAFALRGVAPNPAGSEARVRFALPGPGEAVLSLLDTQGRRLRDWGVGGSAGENELALNDLGRLPPGLYWLRLRQGASEARVRIALVR